MLSLGPYRFSLTERGFTRRNEYRWPALERIGEKPLLQSIGPGEDVIELAGVIYSGGLGQINNMRNLSKPLLLIDGQGNILGHFVIVKIEETQKYFFPNGEARKIEFHLSLKHYDNALSDGSLNNPVDDIQLDDDVLQN
ncbi:phage tail protein [Wolbachia endosymbiont of Oryzaephilus surinamensis]|uniref:phage tail protein n=1 Tax=Wolbachia endosymbiont of Oryzaephilus surinamensis TaxID=573241 RepID=UPI0021D5271E|nr:phage tail protein [Wolbachia endosymbiont of Oryzaephilus surinamensis]UXX40364.1 phage tail protein [Wolbachia endosymbiont of Oryzaephilus surinamensis]